MTDDIHGGETMRECLDKHSPNAASEDVVKLELWLRDLERRVERLERSERMAVENVEITGR
jgi:hypothetical protein